MRILICSNAPWVPSGYGMQTRNLVLRLRRLGHEVAVHCLFGLEGGPIVWDGVSCYPRGDHPFGQDLMAAHAAHFDADLVITLFDVWVLDPDGLPAKARWAPWFPADHEPLPQKVVAKLAKADFPIAMSRFGFEAARAAGIESTYVPHGIDTAVFQPIDRSAARADTGLSENAFVVGMVAANRDFPSRKGYPEAFQAFARLREKVSEAVLYVHAETGPHPNVPSVDLRALAGACGIADAVIFADRYALAMGCREEHLARLYSAFDVLLAPSHGEGFGIPIIEAQACGCPVIGVDWTACGELCGVGWKLERADAERVWTQLASWRYSPRVEPLLAALLDAYARRSERSAQASAARAFALAYDVDRVFAEYWGPFLAAVAARPKKPPEKRGAD